MGPIYPAMSLADHLKESFLYAVKRVPWVLAFMTGENTDLATIPERDYLDGLFVVLMAVHENTLTIARKIDGAA